MAACLAAPAIACGGAPAELSGRAEPAGRPPVDVRVIVQPEHRRDGARYLRAAVASVEAMARWVGPSPRSVLTVVDPPWHGSVSAGSPIVLDRSPWWSASTSMSPELATSRAIARRAWAEAVDTAALPSWFVGGLVEYTARRIVTPIFQGENVGTGFAMIELRDFGGFVPTFLRVRLAPESDGDPLPAYRARPRADGPSLEAKAVLTLNTLERWVGTPAFDAALAGFVERSRGRRPALDDFSRVVSASAGQDLTWLLQPSLGGSAVFDYAVADLRSERSGDGYETTVAVERRGDGQFTGAAAPRVGPFESGRGIALAVAFADGNRIVDAWDGRDARRTFRYRSAARAVSAEIDPDRVMLLDVWRTNNGMTLAPRAGAAAARWSMRWLLWLEQTMLTFVSLV